MTHFQRTCRAFAIQGCQQGRFRLERKLDRKRSPTDFWPVHLMPKNEDEITPLRTDDNIVEVATGEDSPKSKSPRHGHSTSKEVSCASSPFNTVSTPSLSFAAFMLRGREYIKPVISQYRTLQEPCNVQVASAVTSSWVSRRFLSGW